tara:strand:+ start:3307 stop:4524 length:1218 start_codon:yes stop_codon:yes gene_type:complete
MLLTIIAVIALIFFASYFVKIKINKPQRQGKGGGVWVKSEEVPPPSSDLALYAEKRYEFFEFAEFFLLYKRPYGLVDDIDLSLGDKGSINGSSRGDQGTGGPEGCKAICINDPSCNAWQFESADGLCKKFNVNDEGEVERNSEESNEIGYIFRPEDSWAVDDLSGLPQDKETFQTVANFVIQLNCKDAELKKRASNVLVNSNVKYCFEKELSQDGRLPEEYVLAKEGAMKSLENSLQFFIFSGDSGDFPNKAEFSLLAAKIFLSLESYLFEDDSYRKSAILDASNELISFYEDYYLLKTYFQTSLDRDNSDSITKDELVEVYREAIETGQNINSELIGDEFISTDTCLNTDNIVQLVALFFSKYDLNQDGLVSLQELLSSKEIPQPKFVLESCDKTETETETESE